MEKYLFLKIQSYIKRYVFIQDTIIGSWKRRLFDSLEKLDLSKNLKNYRIGWIHSTLLKFKKLGIKIEGEMTHKS